MALTVVENLLSRPVQLVDGKLTGRRSFKVFDATGAGVNPEDVIALEGTTLPGTLEAFPGIPTMRVVDRPVLQRSEGHKDQWDVEYEYKKASGGGIVNPNEPGFIEVSSTVSTQFYEMWRTGATIPTDGTAAGNNTTDISGTANDLCGTPATELRKYQTLHVTEVRFGAYDVAPLWGTYRSLRGTRNSAPFFSAVKGKVLYEGAEVNRIDVELWTVSHSFLEDEFYHLVQVPKRYTSGDFAGEPFRGGPPPSQTTVTEVYWRQPFPNFGDFDDLDIGGG